MIFAVILVNSDTDSQLKVLESLKNVEGVEETHALWGVYDFIVKIKAVSLEKLREILSLNIRKLAGVTSLLTLMIVEEPTALPF